MHPMSPKTTTADMVSPDTILPSLDDVPDEIPDEVSPTQVVCAVHPVQTVDTPAKEAEKVKGAEEAKDSIQPSNQSNSDDGYGAALDASELSPSRENLQHPVHNSWISPRPLDQSTDADAGSVVAEKPPSTKSNITENTNNTNAANTNNTDQHSGAVVIGTNSQEANGVAGSDAAAVAVAEAGAGADGQRTVVESALPQTEGFDATSPMFAFMEDEGASLFTQNAPSRFDGTNATSEFVYGNDENMGLEDYGGGGSGGSGTERNDESEDGPEPDLGAQEVRVDASTMDIVDNPLQKRGRHTVITGQLPYDNEYAAAERALGVKMCSLKMQATGTAGLKRHEAFTQDLRQFLDEISLTGYKVPVIGGGPLDLFALMREVLLLGGVKNVVKKRAFRIVGQQLCLPKSCTSAAYVLKNAYTRLLYHYEEKLVHDRVPANPERNVNIKQIVAEDKERERMEQKLRNGGNPARRRDAKRRLPMPMPSGIGTGIGVGMGVGVGVGVGSISYAPMYGSPKRSRTEEPTPLGAAVDPEFMQEYYMSLVANYNPNENISAPGGVAGVTSAGGPDFMDPNPSHPASHSTPNPGGYALPEWARTKVNDKHYQGFVDAAHAIDDRREGEAPHHRARPRVLL